jgi:hypothetical protein
MPVEEQALEVHQDGALATVVRRGQINALQSAMIPLQCLPPEPVHHFAHGMYVRELTIPAGMLVVGKIHLHQHMVMVLKGRAIVLSEFGCDEMTAGFIAVSQPGVKRVVLTLEDTTFATVHLNPTDTQDLEVIEATHIEPEDPDVRALIDRYRKELLT